MGEVEPVEEREERAEGTVEVGLVVEAEYKLVLLRALGAVYTSFELDPDPDPDPDADAEFEEVEAEVEMGGGRAEEEVEAGGERAEEFEAETGGERDEEFVTGGEVAFDKAELTYEGTLAADPT